MLPTSANTAAQPGLNRSKNMALRGAKLTDFGLARNYGVLFDERMHRPSSGKI
jgi:hypothetical protein